MRVLGVDFGARRIGLAVSDPTGTLATPLETVEHCGGLRPAVAAVLGRVDRLEADAAEDSGEAIERFVVGLPRSLEGLETERTAEVRAFATQLARRSGRLVDLQDERLTSREAEARLARHERDWRRRKRKLDAAAAAIILQDWLDEHGGGQLGSIPSSPEADQEEAGTRRGRGPRR